MKFFTVGGECNNILVLTSKFYQLIHPTHTLKELNYYKTLMKIFLITAE